MLMLSDHASATQAMANDVELAAKKRFESFTFRRTDSGVVSPLPSPSVQGKFHARSHSRNTSVSSLSLSNSASSTFPSTFESSSSDPDLRSSSGAHTRPSSHHRRRSSVSTRHESAELMGVALPDLPASSSDKNMSLGDRDSIRWRALLALEGKDDSSLGTPVVEIPQIDEATAHTAFDFPMKSPNALTSSFGIGNSLANKRDSFGKLLTPSSSMKDHLHTLIEEEEEEEEEDDKSNSSFDRECNTTVVGGGSVVEESVTPRKSSTTTLVTQASGTPELSITTPSPVGPRHRPSNLVLRPLSLTASPSAAGLPTPSLTPSPRSHGLRSLTLASFTDTTSLQSLSSTKARPQGMAALPSPLLTPVDHSKPRRPCNALMPASPLLLGAVSNRQSSISYVRSPSPTPNKAGVESLPTPGATPISEKRPLSTSPSEENERFSGMERPLSPDEQSFLHQSQPMLLARISELEKALRSRPRSRPNSMQSNDSISSSEQPSDEMLHLITDLKSERDDLTRDIENWKQRVDDLEKAKSVIERRIEAERREAWQKGEKLGLLEVENRSYLQQLKAKEMESQALRVKVSEVERQLEKKSKELSYVERELERATRQLQISSQVQDELERTKAALLDEQKRSQVLQSRLDAAQLVRSPAIVEFPKNVFSKPRNFGRPFGSTDSWGSTTDVESVDSRCNAGIVSFSLKAVQEEPEDGGESDMDNELAQYEDEDDLVDSYDDDASITSSLGSDDDDQPRSTSHLLQAPTHITSATSVSTPVGHSPLSVPTDAHARPIAATQPTHVKYGSLSKAWTFPRGVQNTSSPQRPAETVDRFFECLEDLDESPPLLNGDLKFGDKSSFSQALRAVTDFDDTLPPFVLSASESGNNQKVTLDAVIEEDEEEASLPNIPQIVIHSHEQGGFEGKRAFLEPIPQHDMQAPVFHAQSPKTPQASGFSFQSKKDPFVTPTKKAISGRPSRIPPPSPPRFFKAPDQRSFLPSYTKSADKPELAHSKPRFQQTASKKAELPAKPGVFHSNLHNNGSTFIPQSKSAMMINNRAYTRSSDSPSYEVDSQNAGGERPDEAAVPTSFSPRLAFQTFTNLMPILSWSPRGRNTLPDNASIRDRSPHTESKRNEQRRYVARETQLEKLRNRLATEGTLMDLGLDSDTLCRSCGKCAGSVTML